LNKLLIIWMRRQVSCPPWTREYSGSNPDIPTKIKTVVRQSGYFAFQAVDSGSNPGGAQVKNAPVV
jgi:hypothetical protein